MAEQSKTVHEDGGKRIGIPHATALGRLKDPSDPRDWVKTGTWDDIETENGKRVKGLATGSVERDSAP